MIQSGKEVRKTKEAAPVDAFAARRVRIGKTQKDRANGAKATNMQNKDARTMWQHDSKRNGENFPYANCNGHRNHYQKTGKGNTTVFLMDSKKR